MKAMVLTQLGSLAQNPMPLQLVDLPTPTPGPDDILVRVAACGVCHTELDEIEGRTPPPHLPMVLGHQAIGYVVETGSQARRFHPGERVGIAWIYSACGRCLYCLSGRENLCPEFRATGRDANGGYAEYVTIGEAFAHPIPAIFGDLEAAPLLCAGAIGYRSLQLAHLGDGGTLGLTGFGASAHLVLLLARHLYPNSQILVFARNPAQRAWALDLGAAWAGDTGDESPLQLDAIIDTTPAWKPIISALHNLAPGGRLVINAIRKEEADKTELLRLDYAADLWMEKEIVSVANVTRSDVRAFLELAAAIPIKPQVQEYALQDANRALRELRTPAIPGAAGGVYPKVLRIGEGS